MTNFEHLRRLPIEKMAEILYTTKHRCLYCIHPKFDHIVACPYHQAKVKSPIICKQSIADWLSEEEE